MARIELPKKDKDGRCYFSYSQFSTWKKSSKDYFKQYFFGERFQGNPYTEFGSKVGEALETGDFSEFDGLEKVLMSSITRLDEFERKVSLDFGDFYLMGYIDTNDKDLTEIIDYKTGSLNKESDYASPDYVQIDLYAAALEQETGKLPKRGGVLLIERKGNAFKGEPLVLGEQVKYIPKDIDPKRIEKVKKDVLKSASDISKYYKVFKKLNSINV